MALPQLNTATYSVYVPGLGKDVSFRPYLVKEEKILMLAMESNDQKMILKAVKDIIQACVMDDVDVDNLAVFDVELLFINLRQKSVGEGIDVNIKCTECGTENPVELDLDKIDVPEIDQEKLVVMLTEDVGLQMRYPSFKDIQRFKPEELEKIDGIMALLQECIMSIFDSDEIHEADSLSKKELEEFINGMNSEQFAKLGGFFNDMPALKTEIKFKCAHCEAENLHELRGIQSFFT